MGKIMMEAANYEVKTAVPSIVRLRYRARNRKEQTHLYPGRDMGSHLNHLLDRCRRKWCWLRLLCPPPGGKPDEIGGKTGYILLEKQRLCRAQP